MSIKRMTAVWELSQHGGSALLFLLAVADYADDNGLAWPGYKKLAERTRVNRRHLTRIIGDVCESGEIWALNRPRQQSNIYVVTPGLDLDGLLASVERAQSLGAATTRGSDKMSLPPQVLGVVTKCPYLDPIHIVSRDMIALRGTVMSLGRAVVVHDPSLSVIDPSVEDQWKTILDELKGQMTKATFNQWLLGSEITGADNGAWRVEVVNPYAAEWLDKRLRPTIERTVERHAPGVSIEFIAKE